MALKRTPRPRDPIQLGKMMLDIAIGVVPDAVDDGKHAGAADIGRKGAASRSASMTSERRTEIAKAAAATRWRKTDKSKTLPTLGTAFVHRRS